MVVCCLLVLSSCVIGCLLLGDRCLSLVVVMCCLLRVVRHLLRVVCWLLYDVVCWVCSLRLVCCLLFCV